MSEEKNQGEGKPKAKGAPVVSPVVGANAAVRKKPEKVIYLGPTIIDDGGEFVVKYGSIYINGLPPDIAERVKTDPELAKMFVPVAKAPVAMGKMRDGNSDLSKANITVKKIYLSRRAKQKAR